MLAKAFDSIKLRLSTHGRLAHTIGEVSMRHVGRIESKSLDGVASGKQDVRRTFLDAPRQIHRVRDCLHRSNRAGRQRGSIHDRRVELHFRPHDSRPRPTPARVARATPWRCDSISPPGVVQAPP